MIIFKIHYLLLFIKMFVFFRFFLSFAFAFFSFNLIFILFCYLSLFLFLRERTTKQFCIHYNLSSGKSVVFLHQLNWPQWYSWKWRLTPRTRHLLCTDISLYKKTFLWQSGLLEYNLVVKIFRRFQRERRVDKVRHALSTIMSACQVITVVL